jgi:hypothetical protein
MKNLDVLNLYYKFAPVLVSKRKLVNTIIIKFINNNEKENLHNPSVQRGRVRNESGHQHEFC